MRVVAVVLAAGEGRRMGGPKALLPLGDETFLAHACRLFARPGVASVVAVLGAEAERVRAEAGLPAVAKVVVNERWRDGMLSSVWRGLDAAEAEAADAVLLHPVDNPLVEPATIDAVLAALAGGAEIAVPSHAGRRGHPAGFSRAAFSALRSAEPDRGARAALAQDPGRVVHVPAGGDCLVDLDRPRDLDAVEARRSQGSHPRAPARAAALAFLAAGTTLFVQVLVHRMVSAKLLNNYAFLVISLTMLGFAFSGVVLTRLLPRFRRDWSEALALCAAGFVLSTLAVSVAFYRMGGGTQFAATAGVFLRESLRWLPTALLFAIPFAFSGLMIGALLSDPDLPAPRVYAFDLAGSALGAFAVIPAIRHLGVEASTLLACALLLAGTVALAPPRRGVARLAVVVSAAALAGAALARDRVYVMTPRAGSVLALQGTLGPPYGVEHVQWDPVARIEVSRVPPPDPERFNYPALLGDDRPFLERFRRILTQNDFAFTFMVDWDGRRESLRGIERTIYVAAYEASSVTSPRVLVVGTGGGFDVLAALRYDAREVTAVEINSATLDIVTRVYRDYCGSWSADPRVRLIEDEGRHYLAAHPDRYDILQLSGVDSYSGTPGAAHVFSESYLYTAEAFDLYFSRLTEDGILNVMRLEHVPPREMLRALVTAVGALRRAGIASPAEHVQMVTARSGNFAALLVKKTPFTADERRRLAGWADASPYFGVSAAPEINARRSSFYQVYLDLRSAAMERGFVAAYPFDISPATDDRPFFFKFSRWGHLLPRGRAPVPVMEVSLLLLAATIGAAALLCIHLPLRLLVARGVRLPRRGRYGLFFSAIGIGYFAVEIALLQRFGLFLGHPNFALSVVLAALLVTSGMGALASPRLPGGGAALRFTAYALAGVVLAERAVALPLLPRLAGHSFPLRVLVVFLLVAPIGFLLGSFLPRGIERLKAEAPALVPWAWGLNGIFSVLAPVFAVGLSVTWGIEALLLAALPVYLVAGWALPPPSTPPSAAPA